MKQNNQEENVNDQIFLDFYLTVSACYPPNKTDIFTKSIVGTWNLDSNKEFVSDEQLKHLELVLYEKIRQKTHGANNDGKILKNTFKYCDLNNNGTINLKEFYTALERFGCTFKP